MSPRSTSAPSRRRPGRRRGRRSRRRSGAAVEPVVAVAAADQVVTAAAGDRVGAAEAEQEVRAGRPAHPVGAGGADREPHPGLEPWSPSTARTVTVARRRPGRRVIEIVRLSAALPKARPTRRLEDVPVIFRLEPSTSSTRRRNVPLSLRPQRTSRATVTRGASSTGRIVMVSRDTPPSTVAVPYASGAGVNVSDPSASTAGAALNNSGREVCSANRAPASAHGARYGPGVLVDDDRVLRPDRHRVVDGVDPHGDRRPTWCRPRP